MNLPRLALACVLVFSALAPLRAQDAEARLSNLATRAQVGTGGVGIVIENGEIKGGDDAE